MVQREFYIEKLKKAMWNGNVKVITGIRRCGKSVLLFKLFKDYLLSIKVPEQSIIEIRLDEDSSIALRNPLLLSKYLNEQLNKSNFKRLYVFIDEIQLSSPKTDRKSGVKVSIFDVLNGLRNNDKIDLYVTGSNSKMLSKDIATEFRGRSTQIKIYPFSFLEYQSYRNIDSHKCLNEYLIYGGMPELTKIVDENEKKRYLIELTNETYIKDIVERKHIDREDILKDVLSYLASQTSSLTNINNVVNAISSKRGEKINYEMVANYIDYIKDSFLINEAKRFDVKGKKYFDYPSKYYFEDTGLRNAQINFRQLDSGHLLENAIYNELIRRGYLVDVGAVEVRDGNDKEYYEVDFVVNNVDQKVYIQSSFQIDDEKKNDSESNSLIRIKDGFKKVIIRNDILDCYYDDNGIFHCNVIDFLTGKINLMS